MAFHFEHETGTIRQDGWEKCVVRDFPRERAAKRALLLDRVAAIGTTLSGAAAKSEEGGTLALEAVSALRQTGMFRLKLCAEMGGAETDPATRHTKITANSVSACLRIRSPDRISGKSDGKGALCGIGACVLNRSRNKPEPSTRVDQPSREKEAGGSGYKG